MDGRRSCRARATRVEGPASVSALALSCDQARFRCDLTQPLKRFHRTNEPGLARAGRASEAIGSQPTEHVVPDPSVHLHAAGVDGKPFTLAIRGLMAIQRPANIERIVLRLEVSERESPSSALRHELIVYSESCEQVFLSHVSCLMIGSCLPNGNSAVCLAARGGPVS